MPDLNSDALGIWEHLKPAIDKEIEQKTRGMVQRRKMKVTTAPSIATGKIGVTEAFGTTEMVIPFATNLISAAVGDMVWVEFMYGATNAFASMFASADEKDWDVAGDLSVGGNARISGNLDVSGSTSLQNTTVNGVLDVTRRRCYATLSSSGWYRVITIAGSGGGIDSWIANICITRKYNISRNETHSISLLACDGSFSFVDEISKSNTQGISDIRYVRDGSYGYIDIYYSLSNENDVCVTFDVKTIPTRQENFVSSDFGSVAQTPSSGSVVAQHSFFPTTGSKITFSPSVGTSFNDYGGCYYMIQNGICFVHVGLSGLSANTSQVVFTLPSRVRPQSLIATCGIGGASVTAISRGWIHEDGRIVIVPDDQYTAIDFSYVI